MSNATLTSFSSQTFPLDLLFQSVPTHSHLSSLILYKYKCAAVRQEQACWWTHESKRNAALTANDRGPQVEGGNSSSLLLFPSHRRSPRRTMGEDTCWVKHWASPLVWRLHQDFFLWEVPQSAQPLHFRRVFFELCDVNGSVVRT